MFVVTTVPCRAVHKCSDMMFAVGPWETPYGSQYSQYCPILVTRSHVIVLTRVLISQTAPSSPSRWYVC